MRDEKYDFQSFCRANMGHGKTIAVMIMSGDDLTVFWELVEVNQDDQSISGIYTPISVGGLVTKGDLISTVRYGLPAGIDSWTFWKADTIIGELAGSTFFFSDDAWQHVQAAKIGWMVGELKAEASSPAAEALAEIQNIAADYLAKGYATTIEKASLKAYLDNPDLYELAFR